MRDRVLVGVDGSAESLSAARWAAAEAQRRGVTLMVVHAWVWPLLKVPLGAAPGAPEGAGLRAAAERLLVDVEFAVKTAAADVVVETALVTGEAAATLIAMSKDVQLLVVGHRGLGGFAEMLLGSVGAATTAHAHCPVVVVRGEHRPNAPVVVGVDAHERTADTVDAAFRIAALRGTQLVAVNCYTVTVPSYESRDLSYYEHARVAEADARGLVETAVAKARKDFPDVAVEVRVADQPAARELVAVSESAGLIVVGTRGAGGFSGLLLGSTVQALLHHAACPVLVWRPTDG